MQQVRARLLRPRCSSAPISFLWCMCGAYLMLQSGSSDPYVTLTVGPWRASSRVIPANLNPVWNESFMATVNDPKNVRCSLARSATTYPWRVRSAELMWRPSRSQDVLRINVFDKDQVGADDSLGFATVPLNDLQQGVERIIWVCRRASRARSPSRARACNPSRDADEMYNRHAVQVPLQGGEAGENIAAIITSLISRKKKHNTGQVNIGLTALDFCMSSERHACASLSSRSPIRY